MIASHLQELVFDIGFHRGEDTDFYLKKGYRVAAFEANPALAEAGRARFAEAIAGGALTLYEGALRAGPAGGTMPFWVNRSHSDWGTGSPAWRDRNARAFGASSDVIEVKVVALEAVVARTGVPHFAKIDIEGLDHEILRGFGAFEERPRFVSVESTKTSFADLAGEIDLLRSLGYRRFKAVQQRTLPGSKLTIVGTDGEKRTHIFARYSSGPFGDDLAGWTNADGVLADYRRIFADYARFGDDSWLQRALGRAPIAALQLIAGRPLPGWYDTHARLD